MKLAPLLLLATTSLTLAQQPQRIGVDQPLAHPITSLPTAQREAITQAIEPTLWNSLGDYDDADQMQAAVNAIERDLRYDRRTFNGHQLTLLQAHDFEGCGAQHNCLLFILDPGNTLLLNGVNAYSFTLLPTQHNALPDILLTQQTPTLRTCYQFTGQIYKQHPCV